MMLPIHFAAQEHPNELAYDDGKTQITYAELEGALSQSTASKVSGLQPGDHVSWCPRNDADAFLTFWALQQRGCVACPVSHRFPDSARDEILHRIDAKWLPDLDIANSPATPVSPGTDQRATIILSSGSTGIPKAIVHTMAAHNASAAGAAENMPLNPGDRWLWSLPLFHISGLSILVRCAVAGATVVGVPGETKPNAEFLDRLRVTHLSVVTTQLRRLLAEDSFPSKHLRSVLLGGSHVDEQMVAEARAAGVPVSTTYGLSEMGSQVTTSTPTGPPSTSGRVLGGRELQINSSGEILVRGQTLCLGYYDGGIVHSIVDDEGWFNTKDLGSLNQQGQLTVKGRVDNMFISGGENIHPESVERAMMSVFDIEQVIVAPRQDEVFGFRPVAFVQGVLPEDWESVLREKIQGYEIPVEILDWPADAEGSIKPNRKQMQRLAIPDP